MENSKPPIEQLTERMMEARGIDYQTAWEALKLYLDGIDDETFLLEIKRIENVQIFRYLWSMGLNRRRQLIVTDFWNGLVQ